MIIQGAAELAADLARKSQGIYGDAMRSFWDAADAGAAAAAATVRRHTGETAETMSPATYGRRYLPEGHIRSVWGPVTKQGWLLEVGTAHMGPFPYLGQSLEAVAGGAIGSLEQDAGDL